VIVAVLALAASGCGGKSSARNETTTATTVATTAADEQPPPTATTALKPPPQKQVEATQRRLVAAALKPADVGAGWKLTPLSEVRPVTQWCNRPLAGGISPYADTGVAFKQQYGSAITQELSAYAGDGAKRVLADFRNVVRNCPSWQATPEPGSKVNYSLTPIGTKVKDGVAVRVRSSNVVGNFEVVRSIVAVVTRRGQVIDLVTQTANAGLNQPQAPALALAERADRRLAGTG
jgi:hypothetical protein